LIELVLYPYDCIACGKCCTNRNDSKWIEVSDKDAEYIHRYINKHPRRRPWEDNYPDISLQPGDIQKYALKQEDDGRCVFLERISNNCMIYSARPEICKEIQRGDEICIASIERNS
jgi:Fe-S-cluster containining protein